MRDHARKRRGIAADVCARGMLARFRKGLEVLVLAHGLSP